MEHPLPPHPFRRDAGEVEGVVGEGTPHPATRTKQRPRLLDTEVLEAQRVLRHLSVVLIFSCSAGA